MSWFGKIGAEVWGASLIVLLAAWVFFWNANPAPAPWFTAEPQDFYGYQTAGFLSGHLYTSNEPDPALLALDDPYDPVANAPYRVHDMTLWQGRYYLYFGSAPAVLFFAPVKLLTGTYPTEPLAVAFFTSLALALGAILLVKVRRWFFPLAPVWVVWLGILILGFANPILQLTTRPQVYQVPIACAYALLVGALISSQAAIRSVARAKLIWLAVAGTCVGLALGARPNSLVATPWLLVPVLVGARLFPVRRIVLPMLAAYGPIAVAGVVILLLNWLRFGSVTEFGAAYQLAGSNQVTLAAFAVGRILTNAPEYLFAVGTGQSYFPFAVLPEGRPWGVAVYLPWVWMGLASFYRPRSSPAGGRALALAAGVAVLANLVLIGSYFATVERYLCDFAPALLIMATIGAMVLASLSRPAWRLLVAGIGMVTLVSGGLIFAQRARAPEDFSAVARFLNQATGQWEAFLGKEYGALRIELELPATPVVGLSEPLVETGRQADQRDWLQLTYRADDEVSLEFFHAGFGLVNLGKLSVPVDRRLVVEFRAGGLLPPRDHPLFEGWSADAYKLERDQLWVRVNGTELIHTTLNCYPAGPGDVYVGRYRVAGTAPGERFSGRIIDAERLAFSTRAEAREPALAFSGAPIALSFMLPVGRSNGGEPLLATGRGNQSDLLYLEFLGGGRIRFGLDHFGYGGLTSDPVEVDATKPVQLEIWSGGLADETTPAAFRDRLIVRLAGTTLIDGRQEFYPAKPNDAVVGLNPNGASTAQRQFGGRLLEVSALAFEDF